VLLVAGGAGNFTARGLEALGVRHERVTSREYAGLSPFSHDLLIWGMDEERKVLGGESVQVDDFLRCGGVLLAFRRNGLDPWLPVPVKRGKAYQFGKILAPAHPIFNRPHRLRDADLADVHGGSIYDAFHDLGEGWTPLVSTGAEQTWDKREAASPEAHYGVVELVRGRGRILLVQMIPAYHWFHDRNGDEGATGAKFFENLVRYAASQAPTAAATRPPPVVPANFRRHLPELMAAPKRGDGIRFDDGQWAFTSRGAYTMKADRRGVLTFTHADAPSAAGAYAQVARTVELPPGAGPVMLRWYESDTYCGGRERVLGGKDHGKTAALNYRKDMRYAQVLVNGKVVWEEDVLGRNPQPARRRVRTADISDAVDRAAGKCEIVLRVEDRRSAGEAPFAIDVFWAAVEVVTDLTRAPAAAAFETETFEAAGDGVLALKAGQGTLIHRCRVPKGRYRVALELRDDVAGRSSVRVNVGAAVAGAWTLTADDCRWHWAATGLVELAPGAALSVAAACQGEEQVLVRQLAIVPERLAAAGAAAPRAAAPRGADTLQFGGAFTVTETAGISRENEVTAQGWPFPRGGLKDATQFELLRLETAGGKVVEQLVPAQTRALASWPDGSVKAALVCFPVSIGAGETREFVLRGGIDGKAPPLAGELSITAQAGALRIETGALTATVSATHGRLVDEVRRNGRLVKPASEVWELALEDEGGRVVRSGGPTVTETRIVDRGPLRGLIVRKGSFADAAGKLIEYRLQLEATSGSDALELQAVIVNREDTPEVFLKRWTMELARQGAAGGCVWLSGTERRVANPGAVLYQHREDRLTWTGADGGRQRVAGKSPGYVRLPGVAVGTRWFWQRFPQAVRFAADSAGFDFIPEAFDEQDLPTRWRDRMLEVTDRYEVGGVGYPQSPGKMGLFRLAQGEALSQQIRFAFDGRETTAPVREALAPLTDRLRAAPGGGYVSDTGVFGQFHSSSYRLDPAQAHFPDYERSVARLHERHLAKREKRREYGFENFGDDTFEWGYGPSYTYWSNSEYDHHHGFALQYLRSGDPKWWELCEQQARMYRDVVVIHHAPKGSLRRGGPRHHNATSMWMPQHDEQYWVADHTRCSASAGHSWAEGLIDYWFLTGDPWTEEVVREMAGWYCDIAENKRFGAGGQERGPGWALIALSALANALGEERIIRAGWTVADWIMDWQDPLRGVVSVPISEQPSYEGGSTFMHGIVGRGLGRWYDVTGDARVRDACLGVAEWITTEPMGEPGRFWYKQSPNNSKRYGATGQCLTALTYAYSLTDDPWFAETALALLRQTGASTRSLSWYPQALHHLQRLVWPAEVTVAPRDLVVTPKQPGRIEASLRSTALTGWADVLFEVDAPAPFRVQAPEPFRLELGPGKTARVDLEVSAPRAPAEGEVTIRVRMEADGAEPGLRRIPVRVRSVARLVRIEAHVSAARLTPPMAISGAGADAFAHTPRGPDFVAKPHPKDGAGGGCAAWTFDLPVAGRYTLAAEVMWLDGEGNSFYAAFDDEPEELLGNRGAMGRWIWVERAPVALTAGKHVLRIRTREDGARIRRVRVVNCGGE